jgi:hypothetical protein
MSEYQCLLLHFADSNGFDIDKLANREGAEWMRRQWLLVDLYTKRIQRAPLIYIHATLQRTEPAHINTTSQPVCLMKRTCDTHTTTDMQAQCN